MNLSDSAIKILEKRYLLKDRDGQVIESPDEMFRRVAHAVAAVEDDPGYWESVFYQAMVNLRFLPNSPTLMNAGTERQMLSACFVLPVEDSMESIFTAVKNAALIHQSGGGTGFSFSHLRPKNDIVRSTMGVASGPVSFMTVFNAATEVVKQGSKRRGANMGVLHVSHPDIEEFVTAKRMPGMLENFNLSVAVDDSFMEAVRDDKPYVLVNPRTGEAVKTVRARDLFDLICESAWASAEPGIIFIDEVNRANPVPSLGRVEATNPCSEAHLLPYEACNLGSINLAKHVCNGAVDWSCLEKTVCLAVRFLNDVIDVCDFPLSEIESMVSATRKIGLGVMGFADMLIDLGLPYDSERAHAMAATVMNEIQRHAWNMSAALATERGRTFPAQAKGKSVFERPVYNATVTCIAPTGTISMIADCSSGIEPIYAVAYTKTVLDGTPFRYVNKRFEDIARVRGFWSEALADEIVKTGSVQNIDGVPDDVKALFKTAHEISPEAHLRMQATFQKYVDMGISKTINMPASTTVKDVADIYMLAWNLRCKGITIYRDGSRASQVLTTGSADAPSRRANTVPKTKTRPRTRVTYGSTEKVKIGCGSLFVTVNSDEVGLCEVFTATGKYGGCPSQSEATSRLISLALRSGIAPEAVIGELKDIRCPACLANKAVKVKSCPDAISKALERERVGKESGVIEAVHDSGPPCPECGKPLLMQSGCQTCPHCGFSKCG